MSATKSQNTPQAKPMLFVDMPHVTYIGDQIAYNPDWPHEKYYTPFLPNHPQVITDEFDLRFLGHPDRQNVFKLTVETIRWPRLKALDRAEDYEQLCLVAFDLGAKDNTKDKEKLSEKAKDDHLSEEAKKSIDYVIPERKFEEMGLLELKLRAKQNGIRNYSSMTKAKLLTALKGITPKKEKPKTKPETE